MAGVWNGRRYLGDATHELIIGTAADETIFGGGGNDTIKGNGGDDILSGGDGNDVIDGGSGVQSIDCGAGEDTVSFQLADNHNDFVITNSSNIDLGENGQLLNAEAFGRIQFGNGNNSIVLTQVSGANVITGSGNDTIQTGAGNDTVSSGHGQDLIRLGEGDDLFFHSFQTYLSPNTQGTEIYTEGGNDLLFLTVLGKGSLADAGDGNDEIYYFGGEGTVFGGAGDDWIQHSGDIALNFIGGMGNDSAEVPAEMPSNVALGSGADFLQLTFSSSGTSTSRFDGGAGIDRFQISTDAVIFYSGHSLSIDNIGIGIVTSFEAFDIRSGLKDDLFHGGSGNDTISSWGGSDRFYGGAGDDRFTIGCSSGYDRIFGGEGYDRIELQQFAFSSDVVFWGTENRIWVQSGGKVVARVEGVEEFQVYTANGADLLKGAAGDDYLDAGGGNNRVIGGAGDDLLYADYGNDTMAGGDGDDTIIGGSGSNRLGGGAGDDIIFANFGKGWNTIVWGGLGHDRASIQLEGGPDESNSEGYTLIVDANGVFHLAITGDLSPAN